MPKHTRIRRGDLVPWMVGLYALVIVGCGVLAVVSPDFPIGVRIGFAVLAVPFVILIIRTLPMGVYLEPDGVVIRNVLATRRLKWDEIDRFAYGRYRGYGDYRCGVVLLARGGQVTIGALNPPAVGDMMILPLIDELNAHLAQATGRSFKPAIQDL
jgi:hypothetical protein